MEILEQKGNSKNIGKFLKQSIVAGMLAISVGACSTTPSNDSNPYYNSYENFEAELIQREKELEQAFLSQFKHIESQPFNLNYYADLKPIENIANEKKAAEIVEDFTRAKNGDVITLPDGTHVLFVSNQRMNSESIDDIVDLMPDSTLNTLGISERSDISDKLKAQLNSQNITSAIIHEPDLNLKVLMVNDEQAKQWLENDDLNIFNNNLSKARMTLLLHEAGHLIYPHGASNSNEILADLFAIRYAPLIGVESNSLFQFLNNHRNVTNAEYRSNHTNPFQYDVLEKALEKNPNLFDNLDLNDLYQISEISNALNFDVIDQSISNGNISKVLERQFNKKDNNIIDIRRAISTNFIFNQFKGHDTTYSFDELKTSLLNNDVFTNIHKEDALAIFKSIEKNIVNEDGQFSAQDLTGYLRSNQPLIDILKETDSHNGYLKNRLSYSLLATLYTKENPIQETLKQNAEDLSDYVVRKHQPETIQHTAKNKLKN